MSPQDGVQDLRQRQRLIYFTDTSVACMHVIKVCAFLDFFSIPASASIDKINVLSKAECFDWTRL